MSATGWRGALRERHGEIAEAVLARADGLLPGLARPETVERNLRAFLDASGSPAAALRSFAADPLALELHLRLCAASQHGAEICRLRPHLFWEIVQERGFRQVLGRRELARDLVRRDRRLHDEEHRIATLLRFQQQHLLRVMLGDVVGVLGFSALVGELSDVADAVIAGALRIATDRLTAEAGDPPVAVVVLAMGKLGSRELNYSSDIDLVFVGQRRPGVFAAEGHDYLRRCGQALLGILGGSHPAGRLYRVDLRLRPHGRAGEVATGYGETLDYYYGLGRPWERQALIKARPCAGDLALGERLLGELRPWIYPPVLRPGDLTGVRRMRRELEERSGPDDLKDGSGGIRDVEFLVQSCQLAHGGRHPELQRRSTLEVLDRLAALGVIAASDRDELGRCYPWLRLVEHRLQMWEARRLHALPSEPAERHAFALRCGYGGDGALARFEDDLAAIRRSVRDLADRYFRERTAEEEEWSALIADEAPPEPEVAGRLLGAAGFADPTAAALNLRTLAREPFFVLSRPRTERRLLEFLPALLAELRRSPDPDRCLANFRRIVEAVGGRSEFYRLLLRRTRARRIVFDLAGWADYAVAQLTRFPAMPDEVFEGLRTPPRDRVQLEAEARALTAGVRDFLPQLAYLQAREMVEAAIRDLEGMPQGALSHRLGDVAGGLLQVVWERCAESLRFRRGEPRRADGAESRFAVIGLGKFGSRELTYAGDLDVIFVCDPGGTCADGGRDSEAAWERVAKDLVAGCREHGIYRLDPRLRPWGEQGQLVINRHGLERYWAETRPVWERLAMVRARPVAGDAELGGEAVAIIRRGAWAPALPADGPQRLREMRERLARSAIGTDELKRAPGGYVDIEFLAHYLALRHLSPADAAGLPVDQVLARLPRTGVPLDIRSLRDALGVLRRVESRLRLSSGKATSHLPRDRRLRARIARCCGYADPATMDAALEGARAVAGAAFAKVFG